MGNIGDKIMDYHNKYIKGITDSEYLVKIINSKSNFLDNIEIANNLAHSKIEMIKFAVDYCEKINKKININSLYLFECVSEELKNYLEYLNKHNYSTYKYDPSNENKSLYILTNKYAITKNIKNKYIYCDSIVDLHCMYVYNNQIIYENRTTYIYKINYVIYLS